MRKEKKVIQIKDVLIGGNNSIKLQSMTNTKTSDIDATIKQIKEFIIHYLILIELLLSMKQQICWLFFNSLFSPIRNKHWHSSISTYSPVVLSL